MSEYEEWESVPGQYGVGHIAFYRFEIVLKKSDQDDYFNELLEAEQRRRPLGFAPWEDDEDGVG